MCWVFQNHKICLQVEGEGEREFWRQQQTKAAAKGGNWLPHTLTISLADSGRISVREGSEVEEVRLLD